MTTKNFDQSWLNAAMANNAQIARDFEERRKAVRKTTAELDTADEQNRIARAVVAQAIDDKRRENDEEAAQLRRIAANAGLPDPDAAGQQGTPQGTPPAPPAGQQGTPQGTPPVVPQPTQQLPVVQPTRSQKSFSWIIWVVLGVIAVGLVYGLVAQNAWGDGNFAANPWFIVLIALVIGIPVGLLVDMSFRKRQGNGQANT